MQDVVKKYQNHMVVSILLLLFGIALATAQYTVTPYMAEFAGADSFNLGNNVSWLMSIFTFVGIVLAIPTGMLAKKFGPKKMLMAACAFVVVGSLVGAFAGNNGAIFIVSRGIEGVALIFTTICGPLAVQKYCAPDKVGSATGIWALWVCLGSVVGGTVTPSIYAATGFMGTWIIYAALAVVFAVIVAVAVKSPGESLPQSIKDTNEEIAAQPGEKVSYAMLMKPNIIIFLVGWTIFNMVLLAMLTYSPTFLQAANMDKTMAGFVSTLPMLLAVVSSPLFGALTDKTGKHKILIAVAMLACGPCTFLMLTQTGPLLWVAAVIFGIVGLGAPVMFINCWTYVVCKPELMAIAMGFFMLIQSLGQFLGTAVAPAFLGAAGNDFTMLGIAMCVLGLVGTGCTLLVKYDKG
jgi:MFS family permease